MGIILLVFIYLSSKKPDLANQYHPKKVGIGFSHLHVMEASQNTYLLYQNLMDISVFFDLHHNKLLACGYSRYHHQTQKEQNTYYSNSELHIIGIRAAIHNLSSQREFQHSFSHMS